MSRLRIGPLVLGALFALGSIGALAYRRAPASSGYPLTSLAPSIGKSGLWRLAPAELELTTNEDEARLEATAKRIDEALEAAAAAAPLLDANRVDDLDANARKAVRDAWSAFMDPLLELDAMKRRYQGWFAVDYMKHASLHARAFALSHAALSAQVAAGQRFLQLVAGRKLAQTMFDEAVPELGLPRGTFTELRRKLANAVDQAFVPVGAHWYSLWLARHLASPESARFDALVRDRQSRALAAQGALGTHAATGTAKNELELLKSTAYVRWFPVQKEVAEWAGDTRFVPETRRLIRDAQLDDLRAKLRPGDVILERRNWYLSNVGLPGFWPHAAIYVGTREEIASELDADPEVRAAFGGRAFSEHLADKRAPAWKALAVRDESGHPPRILEAVSEGVVVASLEHSCGADYVGALRARRSKRDVALALDRAFSYFGRPYDFDFDFATDDALVCSELVLKAFEVPTAIKIPFVTTAGRRTVPPTELVRLFARERTLHDPQLEFVAFLDGREKTHTAEWSDSTAFAASAERPKWDLAQP